VQWTAIQRHKGATPVKGEPLFQFNNDGSAQGGSLSVLRAGQGVHYRVNWLLGRIEQTLAQAPS
jgi:general secretion pathway protein H